MYGCACVWLQVYVDKVRWGFRFTLPGPVRTIADLINLLGTGGTRRCAWVARASGREEAATQQFAASPPLWKQLQLPSMDLDLSQACTCILLLLIIIIALLLIIIIALLLIIIIALAYYYN